MRLTNEQLAEIKARCDKATPGPWIDEHGFIRQIEGKADLLFIANARTDIPALVAEVERLREVAKGAAACMAIMVAERNDWKARCEALEVEIGEPNLMVNSKQSLRAKITAYKTECEMYKAENARLKARCEALERVIKHSTTSCETCKDNDNKIVCDRVKTFESQREAWSQWLKDNNLSSLMCGTCVIQTESFCADECIYGPRHVSDQLVDANKTINPSDSKEPDHIIDVTKKDKDGWVVCSERLPEDGNLKLVLYSVPIQQEELSYEMAYYNVESAAWEEPAYVVSLTSSRVIYWRDIPPPPEV